ncbi:MAG TPA: class I SAM-dependent methyltransferase [Ktedonobacteraceae bacterium]|nr:class I SAM-dependent methyltransferase [Ktedonobacteraceae bacterium]
MGVSGAPLLTDDVCVPVIALENVVEMVRLIEHDRLMMTDVGGVFPELDTNALHAIARVLDVYCGPGGWAREVARLFPSIEVVGVDAAWARINYARATARVLRLPNIEFHVMDVPGRFHFADESFDMVSLRSVSNFVTAADWPALLRECRRVLVPDGIVRVSESVTTCTNKVALEALLALDRQALFAAGLNFTPAGPIPGVTTVMTGLLRAAGFADVRLRAVASDFSYETALHYGMVENLKMLLKLLQPFWLRCRVATQEQIDALYEQALDEMQEPDFCGLALGLTAWGKNGLS